MRVFCLDSGGTETRGALFDDAGNIAARATGPGGALSLGADQAEAAIRAVWQKICDQISPQLVEPGTTRLFGGIAGLGLGRVSELHERLDDFAQTHFVGDGYAALLAATGGRPGALISVGTGVAALRLDAAGNNLTLSSWGFPGGDLGSGAWLGLRLTNELTRYLDGILSDPPLPPALVESVLKVTGDAPSQIMVWLTTARAGQYASLAPLIVASAEAGDPYSRGLMHSAAVEITDVAVALYGAGTGNIYLSGGLGKILLPYCAEMASGFDWRLSSADPLQGTYLLATGRAPDEKLLSRPNLSATEY